MDGETYELLEETEQIPFTLSRKEFEIAATLCAV